MNFIHHFPENIEFSNFSNLVDILLKNPDVDGPIFVENEMISFGRDDVILNGKPRRFFTNMLKRAGYEYLID